MPRSSSQGIRRAVFGYRRGAVSQLLVERDEMQRAAESAILGAEARVRELEAELEEVRRGIDLRDAQVRQMEAELEELERTATEQSPKILSREVDSILSAAQETATRIVARARAVSRREAEQVADDVQGEVAKLVAWREEAVPAIKEVQATLGELREAIRGLSERLAAALEPLERLPLDDVEESIAAVQAAVEDNLEIREALPDGSELRITGSRRSRRRRVGAVGDSPWPGGANGSDGPIAQDGAVRVAGPIPAGSTS